ncbi:acyltransferase family protein [Brevibacterium album]|uniref:acyltransferase family protein n=1 Tax=Brevibacterium album TaxID=417948 RepID=UPI0003FB57B1|nr:acyltransferase family protein [Brevibacterium album]
MPVRDRRIDNAKGVLIVLVVLGHLLEGLSSGWDDGLGRLVLTSIYAFHMPAFVFLAGITAKSKRLGERILNLLLTLLAAQLVYYVAERLAGDPFEWSWIRPHWILWFLFAMIAWYFTVPLIERAPRVMVVVSVATGLLAGAVPFADYEFSLSRALVFWSFFVLGKVFGRTLLTWPSALLPWFRVGMVIAAACPPLALFVADLEREWLYGSRNYEWLEVGLVHGIFIRLCLYLIAGLAIVALLTAVPDRTTSVTTIGARSLSVYLLHGLAVILLTPTLATIYDGGYERAVQIGAVVLCALLAWALAQLLAVRPLHWAVSEPSRRLAGLLLKPLSTRSRPRSVAISSAGRQHQPVPRHLSRHVESM